MEKAETGINIPFLSMTSLITISGLFFSTSFLRDSNVIFSHIYVALENYRDGVAIGNVRSTGEYPASKFYHHILKNISDPLYSDRRQTTGGRKIWADLAKHYPDVNIADQGPGHRLRASFDNRSAHGDDITESAGGQLVYHAATARDFGSIMQKGLTFFNPSRWVKAGNPDERYQDGPSVFAFEHPVDA